MKLKYLKSLLQKYKKYSLIAPQNLQRNVISYKENNEKFEKLKD